MHNILLFDVAQQLIPLNALQRVFQSNEGFQGVRYNTPSGTPIEADYVEKDDFTTVRLNSDQKTISIRGTSDAALRAAWAVHNNLDKTLRMVDTDYSFDFIVGDFLTIEELMAAVEDAWARQGNRIKH